MKKSISIAGVFLLLLGFFASAQITKSKGVGSVISFKNKNGQDVENATVKAVTYDAITWIAMRADGRPYGGRTLLADLPEDLARDFGYDAKKVAATQKAYAEAQALRDRQAAEQRIINARVSGAMATKMSIRGTVSQVLENGLMVVGNYVEPKVTTTKVNPTGRFPTPFTLERTGPPTEDGSPLFVGRCLITDAETQGWADGQPVRATVYPNGTYQYTSVGAGLKTVPKFTLDPSKVVTPATPSQFETLKQTYIFNTPTERRYVD